MRLRSKLILVLAATISLGSAAVFLIVRGAAEGLLRSFVLDEDREKAELYAEAAASYYRSRGGWAGAQEYLAGRASLGGETRVTLVNLEGVVVADSGGDFLGSPHPPRHVAKGLPVLVDGARVGTIMAGSMVDSSLGDRGDLFLASITRALLVGIAASSAAALVLGAVFSAALLRPLRRLTRAFARVAGGDLAARVPVEGDEELALLAASFNGMTEELAALEEEKRRVIADSAHELRTPVTLIRGTVE
ncbi:MAG TPA: HAMP domain-containing protein, partial [Spirochaetales bacterium]|nr:HAMP domain-containing protein [Spirochaetales bacterium]